jgi:1-acyl-sn-glycerol-3-phosphate acyltransferase
MVKFGFFPLGLGNHLTFTVHKPISVKDFSFEEIIKTTETTVVQGIKN